MRYLPLPRPAPLGAFAVAALLGLSATYWTLRWPQPSAAAIDQAPLAQATGSAGLVDAPALARLLGAAPATNPEQVLAATGRLVLVGTVAQGNGGGAALIAIDGKPAKSFAVGSAVEPGLFLTAVGKRSAALAASPTEPATQNLSIPTPAP